MLNSPKTNWSNKKKKNILFQINLENKNKGDDDSEAAQASKEAVPEPV